ncbi:MAG: GNAT family N-acetyltransferase [Proteobacteria bacterium]|nr:GNAT family N-acetyltransferase [Pseudomonadota bacterium]
MIRRCSDTDFEVILDIINDGARAYKGVIPDDCWHEPYMTHEELSFEIQDGVLFWGYEEKGRLIAVMGIQDKGDVMLIRHAYVRTAMRNQGIGEKLLRFHASKTVKPILIGTWADAVWAVAFYKKHGYLLLETEEKNRLLMRYWTISKRQIETSVVLADKKWTGI